MKFLKGLALSLLSFFLFLSLTTFGLVFVLNSTVLNPDFITSELESLDISSLAEEILSEQTHEEEFGTALVNTITKLEPSIKEQVSATTYSIFDYLLGKRQNPDLALTLRNTILNTDFVVSLVDELDISSLAGGFLKEKLTEGIPEGAEYLGGYIDESLDDVLTELEPWFKEQISDAADPILDYLLGESQSLSVVISLQPVKESLKDNLRDVFLQSPPPELAGVPQAALEPYFNQFYGELSAQMPSTFEFNESLLGTEIPANIAEALAGAEGVLEQVRQGISYFQLGYNALIGFIVLVILGIILIKREVRSITRGIGITFLVVGAFGFIETFLADHFAWPQMAQLGIPPSLQTWITQLANDFLAPQQLFSEVLLAAGVVLVIVSFVYKPRQS